VQAQPIENDLGRFARVASQHRSTKPSLIEPLQKLVDSFVQRGSHGSGQFVLTQHLQHSILFGTCWNLIESFQNRHSGGQSQVSTNGFKIQTRVHERAIQIEDHSSQNRSLGDWFTG